jgi:hypothetical protein
VSREDIFHGNGNRRPFLASIPNECSSGGHANKGLPSFSATLRVSRLLGFMFGEAEGFPVESELGKLAVQLALCVALGAALLRFVPRKTSQTWATVLLILVLLCNLGPLIGFIVAQFSPPSFYLETKKNRLEFNRDNEGEVVGVRVNKPPPECLTYLKLGERTWALALGTITLTLVALVFWRQAIPKAPAAVPEVSDPESPGSVPRSAARV